MHSNIFVSGKEIQFGLDHLKVQQLLLQEHTMQKVLFDHSFGFHNIPSEITKLTYMLRYTSTCICGTAIGVGYML